MCFFRCSKFVLEDYCWGDTSATTAFMKIQKIRMSKTECWSAMTISHAHNVALEA